MDVVFFLLCPIPLIANQSHCVLVVGKKQGGIPPVSFSFSL